MAERYTRVFTQQGQYYCPGAPVVIEAGALLKDNQTGKIIAQIKYKNISKKAIRALSVKIHAKDVTGVEVKGVDSFQYLDLNVRRDDEFGAKTPIVLPDVVARSFSCDCVSAVFSDGTVWECEEDAVWTVLPAPVLLKNEIGAGLAEQYKRDTQNKSEYKVTEYADLWYCACGATNSMTEEYCHTCRAKKAILLAALNIEALRANKKKYDDVVASEQAALAEAERVRIAKNKKFGVIAISAIAILIALMLIITKVVIPAIDYKNATNLLNSGEFIAAEEAFEALGDYKDSQTMVMECRYRNACQMLEEGKYDDAYALLEMLNDYSNASQLILENKFQRLTVAIDKDDYTTATVLARQLTNDIRSQELILQRTLNAVEQESYETAFSLTDMLSSTGDLKSQAMETLYNRALYYHIENDLDHANLIFTYLGDYKDSKDKIHNHTYVTTVIKEVSCTEDGMEESRCICSAVMQNVLPALGHDYNEATCTRAKTCSRCGQTDGSALGHTSESGKCKRCGALLLSKSDIQGTWVYNWTGGSRTYTFSGNSIFYEERLPNGVVTKASGTFRISGNIIYHTCSARTIYTDGSDDYVYSHSNAELIISTITSSYFVNDYGWRFVKS